MNSTTQNNKKDSSEFSMQENSQPLSNTHLDLQELSIRHRKEYFEVKPILDSLGVELMQDNISDKPDFRFTYEGKIVGLETTRCYPPDALIHKNNKEQNKYEIGDKGVDAIIKRYKKHKTEREEWVSLFVGFYDGLYYALRDTSLTKEDIEKIGNEVIEEIENRIKDYHYCNTADKETTELRNKHYKYVSDILWDEPQKGKVILGYGGHAMPVRTIELEPLRMAISNKERKLAEYKQLEQNKEIDEYWLCVNLPHSSRRFFYDIESFEIKTGYSRIYLTQFVSARRIL